jgi:hypothetical protein
MTRHILLVQSDAAAGREDEFHRWYDEEHLPAVLEVDGFVAARRFVGARNSHGDLPPRHYLALYEIRTDDLPGALAALSAAARSMRFSDAFEHATHVTSAFTEITGR